MKWFSYAIIALVFLLIPSVLFAGNPRMDYLESKLLFIGINKEKIEQILDDVRIKEYKPKSVSYKQPNWVLIEAKLYSKSSIQAGVDYIIENQQAFDLAEKDFGIKKQVIAGIIAIETNFGKNTGSYSVFNALYSRINQWSKTKWKSQGEQLIALVKYCLNSKIDCLNLKGSYAGAFGIVQFMPDSVLSYGIDANKDGVVNLFEPYDAVSSAANFLIDHGWNQDKLKALAGYYGSSVGYPKIVLKYADLVEKAMLEND